MMRSAFDAAFGLVLLAIHCRADDPTPPVWPGRFHAMMSQNRFGDLGVVDLWYDYAAGRNLNIIQTQSGEEDGPLFDNERANGTTYYYLPAKAKAKYCNIIDFGVGIIKPDWLEGATYLGEDTSGIYECYKWEQGEIPEGHLRFLGWRPAEDDVNFNMSVDREAEKMVMSEEVASRAGAEGEESASLWGFADEEHASEPHGNIPENALDEGVREGRFITYWSDKETGRPVRWVFFDGAEFEMIRFDPGATMADDMFQLPDYCFEEETVSEEA